MLISDYYDHNYIYVFISPDPTAERNVAVQVPLLDVLGQKVVGVELVCVGTPHLLVVVQRVHADQYATSLGNRVAICKS